MKLLSIYQALLILSGLSLQADCLPDNHLDDQVNAKIDAGTFKDPSVNFRPRFRYWIPDAHVDTAQVAQDIAGAGAVGAAGVEVLGYYLYGANAGDYVPVDWNTYGWGTPEWKKVFDATVKAHADNGLVMDFAMGPNQGQGVPAVEDDEGLMWDLNPYYVTVPIGGSFNDTVPGWGSGKLQAVVTGLITKTAEASGVEPSLPNDKDETRIQNTLAASSLKDMTSKVTEDGRLEVDFPGNKDGLNNTVYAVYLVRSGARNQVPPQLLKGPQTTPKDFVHNGSWIVDHFSSRGAKVMTDFWEKYLLIDGTKEMLMQVGEYAWEDSIEINPNIYWTPDLPKAFEQRRGYSINKWYPLLFHQNSLIEHFGTWFITDEPDAGNSHVADYRTTLTEQYGEYLDTLTSWVNGYLNVQFSSQVGYNMAVDMQSDIPKVNAPECEDLAFGSSIDGFRQFAGPANMAGKRVISAEVGAGLGQTYQQRIPDLLRLIKRLFAGTVNAVMLHGLPYSGEYPNTTWPCFASFTYAWSEMHGRHQPGWDFMRAPLGYLARNSFILQTGVPKMDIAFYQKFTTYTATPVSYEPTDLSDYGFTYQYLNPETLALPEAYVEHGVLAPQRQAYKALVVRANDSMTVRGAEMIAKVAHAGLPVVFSGGLPSYVASYEQGSSESVNRSLSSIRRLSNVHEVPDTEVLDVVTSLGIKPLTRITANSTWWPVWRETSDKSEQYVYIYHLPNYLGSQMSQGEVEFQSTGKPYLYDPWSGAQTPIMEYTQTDTSTTIDFQLAPDQTILVVFKNNEMPSEHAIASSRSVLDVVMSGDGLEAHVGYSGRRCAEWVKTSDGKRHAVTATSAKPFELRQWTLTVEHWDPPTPLTGISVVAVKHNTTHELSQLESWQNIDGLQHVSGRGYYETTFEWPPTNDSTGAIISFGSVVHTLDVSVNGRVLPALDVTAAKADISPYLVKGTNTIRAVVSTTLANVMEPIWDDLLSSGTPPTGLFGSSTKPPGNADYGLLDPVVVTPYKAVKLT